MGFVAASLTAFAIGFVFRVAALWFLWEEPMPARIPEWLLKGAPKRESLKEKMQPGWTPNWEQPPDQSDHTA